MDFKGKTISFLGDSITEGACVRDIASNRYDNIVGRDLGFAKVKNYGIGGTRIAHQTKPSEKARHDLNFCARCYDLDPASDVIVVFGGTNDYGHGDAPLGKVGDKDRTTFCGSVDYLINRIRELYPNAFLVFMTPAHRQGDTLPSDDKLQRCGIVGRPLVEYVDAVVAICKSYNVPVLNLYKDLGVDPNNLSDFEKYTGDGLHYNDEGHHLIAKKLEEFLKSL